MRNCKLYTTRARRGRPKIKFYRCKMKNEGLIPKAITNMKFNVKKKATVMALASV